MKKRTSPFQAFLTQQRFWRVINNGPSGGSLRRRKNLQSQAKALPKTNFNTINPFVQSYMIKMDRKNQKALTNA
jgi:hypothetical protein